MWTKSPVTQANIAADQYLAANAGGVGKNWVDVVKYLLQIKRLEDQLIQDKLANRVPHGRTVRWIGDFLNYTIDSLVRVTRPYIGNKESAYAYSAKIPETRLGSVPDA